MNQIFHPQIQIERRVPDVIIPFAGTLALAIILLTLSFLGMDVADLYESLVTNLWFWVVSDATTALVLLIHLWMRSQRGEVLIDIAENPHRKFGLVMALVAILAAIQSATNERAWVPWQRTEGVWVPWLRCAWFGMVGAWLLVSVSTRVQIRANGLQILGRFLTWRRMDSYELSHSDVLRLRYRVLFGRSTITVRMQLPASSIPHIRQAFETHVHRHDRGTPGHV